MRQKTFDEIQRDRQREWDANRRKLLSHIRERPTPELTEPEYLEGNSELPWRAIIVVTVIIILGAWLLLGGSSC